MYFVGLDRDVFIKLALLCGSDYTEGILGVGVITAMELLTEFSGENLDGLKAFK
jgi:DNA excision repair protein ERCC-5